MHIVTEGEPLSVPCVAVGNPPPSLEWRRGSDIITNRTTLTLEEVSVNDTGIVVDNNAGKVFVIMF